MEKSIKYKRMKSLVITSISDDKNLILQDYAKKIPKNFQFIVIGDKKSPELFAIDNCQFFGIEEQIKLNFNLIEKLPLYSYSRKNIGYLMAIKNNCQEIYETDDDNIAYDTFFEEKAFYQKENILSGVEVVNIYAYFSKENIWPRGLPLECLKDEECKNFENVKYGKVFTPILQGLADKNPDVDAIYRLIMKLPIYFEKNKSITLSGVFSPFNSQNTIWHKKAFPLLYIPSYCAFRVCDIWRSFIALRICFEFGWGINFFSPSVYQERNAHDLLADFEDEIEGYKNNLKIIQGLKELKLHTQENKIYENLMTCYRFFVDEGYIKREEIFLLEAWTKDCKAML